MIKGEALVRHLRLSEVGSLGKANTLASENPLPQLRLRGLDLTRQVAPGDSFPLSVPIGGARPDRFRRTGKAMEPLGCQGYIVNSRRKPSNLWASLALQRTGPAAASCGNLRVVLGGPVR